jgi:hypothetical protein
MNTVRFTRETINAAMKMSEEIIHDMELKIGTAGDDVIMGNLTAMVRATIMSRMIATKTIKHEFKPPTFMEWLLRKPRKIELTVDAHELLLASYKQIPNTVYSYDMVINKEAEQ